MALPRNGGLNIPDTSGNIPISIMTENSALPGQQVNRGAVGATANGAQLNPGAGLAPLSGWAGQQNFNPSMLNENVYDSPWWLLPQVMPGIDPVSPGYQTLRDFGADPLALFNIMQGSQGMLQGGPGEYANFLNTMYSNIGSAGGQWFDMPGMLSNIASAGGEQGEPTSTLGQILNSGNVSQQARTMFNLLKDVSNVGMNPLAARAFQAAVARGADRYGSQAMTQSADEVKGFAQYLQAQMPQLMGGR